MTVHPNIMRTLVKLHDTSFCQWVRTGGDRPCNCTGPEHDLSLLTLDDYQEWTRKVREGAFNPGWTIKASLALGLASEAGEVADKIQGLYRRPISVVENYDDIARELGDCLWYVAQLADMLGYKLGEVAQMNINKLEDRLARGVILGEGDDR